MRLKAMAVERAPTIATVIQRTCHAVGKPPAARMAPRKANGKAKRVCSILIILSVVRMFFVSVAMKFLEALKNQNLEIKTQKFYSPFHLVAVECGMPN